MLIFKKMTFKNDNHGLTLVEIMVALSISILTILAIMQVVTKNSKNVEQAKITSDRSQLLNELTLKVMNGKALLNSRYVVGNPLSPLITPGNQLLLRCLTETYLPTSICQNTFQEFFLFDDDRDYTVAVQKPIAGTNTNPVRYMKNGSPCPTRTGALPNPNWLCPFEVTISFQAVCR